MKQTRGGKKRVFCEKYELNLLVVLNGNHRGSIMFLTKIYRASSMDYLTMKLLSVCGNCHNIGIVISLQLLKLQNFNIYNIIKILILWKFPYIARSGNMSTGFIIISSFNGLVGNKNHGLLLLSLFKTPFTGQSSS